MITSGEEQPTVISLNPHRRYLSLASYDLLNAMPPSLEQNHSELFNSKKHGTPSKMLDMLRRCRGPSGIQTFAWQNNRKHISFVFASICCSTCVLVCSEKQTNGRRRKKQQNNNRTQYMAKALNLLSALRKSIYLCSYFCSLG